MKNFRPGYLAGFQGLIPKGKRNAPRRHRNYSGLGAFGKGAFVPIPNAPPGGVPMEDAINTATGQTYMQDPRCPEGEKMVSKTEPCKCGPGGWPADCPECCDGMDCDPEGTPYPEEDCEDDPEYQSKPQPVAAPQEVQSAPSTAPSAPAAQAPAEAPMDNAAAEAELARLEKEAAAADAIVTQAPALAPPSAYTGSPPPSYAPPIARRPNAAPSDQEKIAQLVEQYQGNRPAPRPRPVMRTVPTAAPRAPQANLDILGWLRTTLFGSGNGIEGWSDSKYKYIIPLLVAIAVVCYIKR